jgi:hypothetical protein
MTIGHCLGRNPAWRTGAHYYVTIGLGEAQVRATAVGVEARLRYHSNNDHLTGGSLPIYARSPEHYRAELNERYSSSAGLTAWRSPSIKEGPSIGAFQRTKVLSESRSSRSGREQLPVLRQNYLIDCMNDAVRRDEIRLRDADSINPYV